MRSGGAGDRLIAELKSRGNAAVKGKSMREAKVLYGRCIELDGTIAALHGNQSMVLVALGQLPEALAEAETAVELDAEWAKGHYRKATALDKLGRFAEVSAGPPPPDSPPPPPPLPPPWMPPAAGR